MEHAQRYAQRLVYINLGTILLHLGYTAKYDVVELLMRDHVPLGDGMGEEDIRFANEVRLALFRELEHVWVHDNGVAPILPGGISL